MKFVGNIASDSEVVKTADGAIVAGKPVIVNSDGTVSAISQTSAGIGTAVDTGFDGSNGVVTTGLPGVSKFVAFGRDSGNSSYGTCIVGVVSGSSISYGSASSTTIASTENPDIIGLTSTTFVLVYTDWSDSNKGKARVGTIDASDNSITYGTVADFETGQTALNGRNNVDRLTDTKFVIAFEDSSDSSNAKAIVGTVSGTSVSFGTAATFATANSSKYSTVGALSDTKIAIAWSDTPSPDPEDGKVVIGTVSGTSISYGSTVVYDSNRVIRHSLAALSDSKFVIAYDDDRTGNAYGTAIIGTVSGTSITLGTATVYRENNGAGGSYIPCVTKMTSDNFVVAFISADSEGNVIEGATSGTSVTFGSPIVVSDTGNTTVWASLVNDEKVVVGSSLSSSFYVSVYTPQSTNLTTENFIGFAKDAVVDGAVATLHIANSISRNQSSLTAGQTYFVQENATIGTAADSTSVTAGTAISATELIVKG
jgi:hypothetical protein